MEIDNILDGYKTIYQPKIKDEVEKYFDYLAEKSKINIQKCKELDDQFNKQKEELDNASNAQRRSKDWRNNSVIQLILSVFVIIFTISLLVVFAGNDFKDSLLALFIILMILLLTSLQAILCVWVYYAIDKKRNNLKWHTSLITAGNLSINLGLFFAINLPIYIMVKNTTFWDEFNSTPIIVILALELTIWVALFVVGAILLLRYSKILKNDKLGLDYIQSMLNETNSQLMKEIKPLKKMVTLNGIDKEITNNVFPFIKLNTKTAQNLTSIASIDWVNDKSTSQRRTSSVRYIQSGELNGFPFLYLSTINMHYYDARYKGTLDVTYLKTRKVNVNGRTITEKYNYTETLTAYYTAPAPWYDEVSALYYYNDAAPKLSFSREPNNAHKFEPKQLDKFIKHSSRVLEEDYQDAIKQNKKFQPILGNLKFESLFDCSNRNNETQFRLLFTPLAQKQYEKLLLTKEFSNGDDFSLVKEKTCTN
ncbi:MAG1210 family protein [Mycoplasma sp. 1932B]|uniref:MAG1210 family protein n=1 Tax=Mycoplasma sp. 1932B TaxID=3401670 RepID=UPI003AAB6B7E